ncbi:hypothetical protein BIZ37_17435 [Photobacterium sp. BZF1]|uniref:hypothetical protein n=1 Tax=Photobacterium sp. BZF1 TaxID=1904457 RepID=UPI0016538DA1|nr:hypothetical protein [Photobacterium sp. BZF1]MBC7004351.1 hypothetical protein [Photobacterium sp. BZF1]
MSTLRKYLFCLISNDLQQASIIKNIITELYPKNSQFFVTSDLSSVNNMKNHILLVDYRAILTQEVTEIDTSVNNNSWLVINIDKTCLLSSVFWIESGFCGALYENQTIVYLANALKCILEKNEYWYTRKELTDAVKSHRQKYISRNKIIKKNVSRYQLTKKEKNV